MNENINQPKDTDSSNFHHTIFFFDYHILHFLSTHTPYIEFGIKRYYKNSFIFILYGRFIWDWEVEFEFESFFVVAFEKVDSVVELP